MAKYNFNADFEVRFIEVCSAASSMNQAAIALGMNYKTLCSHAKRLGCFKPNQAGKGLSKVIIGKAVALQDVFSGKYPYQSHKLKKRLLKENLKMHRCENCNLSEWLNCPIPLELHHNDGNRYNNAYENLRLLCPNCHALTDTYRAKNIRKI